MRECIWFGQCVENCDGKCSDYTPFDGEGDERFYQMILQENTEEYNRLIQLFDGEDEDF